MQQANMPQTMRLRLQISLGCGLLTLLAATWGGGGCSSPTQSARSSPANSPATSPISAEPSRSYIYPLRVSKNGRYLLDREEKPFRIQGDSAQSLIVNLTYAEAESYFSDRRAKGFNTVNINLLEHKFGINAPANRRKDPPFTQAGYFSTPNEAYFAFADSIINLAASKGMLVSLAPMYLGYDGGDEGWWKELNSSTNSQEVCFTFGRYLGNRYKNRSNILWVIGGDYLPPSGSEGERRLHKFMEGIKASGDAHLWAGDWNAPSISTDERMFASEMDVNAVYTSGTKARPGITYDEARVAYQYSPPHPAYLKETGYEDERWVPGDAASVRKYEYWAILGGCTEGGFFGNRDIWEFATSNWWSGFAFGHGPWQSALNSRGTLDMVRLGQLLDSLPWYDLVPLGSAIMKTMLTHAGTDGKTDYITAAVTIDREVLVAYDPESQNITVDITQLRGPLRARWFDPTSGRSTEIAENPLVTKGTHDFVPPGRNSAGEKDWVLILQAR
jgi:hypothetical protein